MEERVRTYLVADIIEKHHSSWKAEGEVPFPSTAAVQKVFHFDYRSAASMKWPAHVEDSVTYVNDVLSKLETEKYTKMIQSMFQTLSDDHTFESQYTTDTEMLKTNDMMDLSGAYSQIATMLQFVLALSAVVENDMCLQWNKLTAIIHPMIKHADAAYTMLSSAVQAAISILQKSSPKSPFLHHNKLVEFMAQVATWYPAWKSDVLTKCADIVAAEWKQLQTLQPRWEHTITDKKYNAVLAKRALLKDNIEKSLTEKIDRLDSAVYNAAFLREQWDAKHVAVSNEIEVAETHLACAKSTITVIAAVNIVDNVGNTEDGRKMAKDLIAERSPEIKGPLLVKLKAIANR